MNDPLYREIILDHWKNPHNYGEMTHPTIDVSDVNLLCGDDVRLMMRLDNDAIKQITFTGRGCAISQASSSILTDLVTGKQIKDIKHISPEDFLEELGMELTPARTKCALLSFSTLQKGLQSKLQQ